MNRLSNSLAALAIAACLCLGTALDNGPSDTQAAQDMADDATVATQLARDTATCHQHYGPHAQIMMLDGAHLVCRSAHDAPTTTAQVQP